MSITVTGRKINVSEQLRSYAEEKVAAALKVINVGDIESEVLLRREKNPANARPAICEITLFAPGHVVRAAAADEDLFAAIDVASAKLMRQLRKFKTRVIDRRVRASERETAAVEAAAAESFNAEALMDELVDDKVVRVKEIEFAPLTEEEALVEIDLLGHDFFAYTDRDTNAVCILYRRQNGGYGLLKQANA